MIQVYEHDVSRAGAEILRYTDQVLLREKFGIGVNEQVFILVGKDGGEKWREMQSINLEDVFSLVDSMPMRQREMKGN